MDSLVNLQFLVDDARCFETVRRLRWPEGVRCPICESDKVARHGHDERQPEPACCTEEEDVKEAPSPQLIRRRGRSSGVQDRAFG
jgi:hypothetical protein